MNAIFNDGETTTVICDDLVAVEKNGKISTSVVEGSVLASVLGEEAVEKRSMLMDCRPNCPEITESDDDLGIVELIGKETCAYLNGRLKVKGWKAKLAKMVAGKLCARAVAADQA